MLDILMVFFWSISYLLTVITSWRNKSEKKVFMPLISGALNFAWEVHALLFSGHWGHYVWLALDIAIIVYNIYILSRSKRFVYLLFTVLLIIALYFVFSTKSFDGMLLSSFAIDIIMAAEFLITAKNLSPRNRIIIGLFRFLGDLFAWINNLQFSRIVLYVGAAVLLLNSLYLLRCFFAKAQIKI